mgnify:FL=1
MNCRFTERDWIHDQKINYCGVSLRREQKFVIYAISGQSLLVTHDLSRSDRVPVAIGDKVMVRGEYVWSEPGGTLIWTTRDNGSGGRNGWIEHKGERYD